MPSPFEQLTGPGKVLKAEPPDRKEFEGLKRSGQARLHDAKNTSLSLESRFDLAYNAAHSLCLAALRWHGYRPSQRYIVFQLLPHTLQLGPRYHIFPLESNTSATIPRNRVVTADSICVFTVTRLN